MAGERALGHHGAVRPLHAKIVAALALAGLPFAFLAALSWGRLPPTWLAVLAPAALIALVVAGAWIARAAARHCDSVRLLEARAAREEGRRLLAEAGAEASSLRDALGRALAGMRELRTGELAGDLGRARSLIQALAAAVAQNDAQAQQAHRLVQEAEKRAGHGAEVASRTIGAMDEISGSSARIASIIAVIDSIAAQTGLLALNAAVEAARAGEHGRGFSVVAAEVRSLAARSAGSAREIKDLVQNSARYVQEGEALVEASGEALAELMAAVKKVEGIVAGIAAASKAQSSGIGEAAQALSRVEQALLRIPGLEA